MNRIKLIFSIAAITVLAAIGFGAVARAQTFHSGQTVNLNQSQKIDSSVYAAGMTVDINSEVNGDVFCAGQTITITGTINGDVICAGQTINIVGKVNGNVRLAGQTISLNSLISGSASLFGQTVNMSSASKIGKDVTVAATDVVMNGIIGRDMVLGGNNATVSGTVNRNIKANVNQLNIGSTAKINGGIYYTSQKTASIAKGAQVKGQVVHSYPVAKQTRHAWYGFAIAKAVYLLISLLVTSLVLVLLVPRLFHKTTAYALPRPWKALLVGFVVSLVLPFILFLLAITIIGLPLAFIFGLAWLLILLLTGPVFGYYLGRLVLRSSTQPVLIMFVGVIILLILYMIPIVNIFAFLATIWFGAGMMLLTLFNRLPRPSYNLAEQQNPKLLKK